MSRAESEKITKYDMLMHEGMRRFHLEKKNIQELMIEELRR
jgi:hypothetical protein